MKKLISIFLLVFASAVFATDDDVVGEGRWFAIAKGKTFVIFYDPYQTSRTSDGIVESIVYGRHTLDGTIIKPSHIRINCVDRVLQTFSIESDRSRRLDKDWHTPKEKSVGAEWLKTLCGYTTESGVKISFVAYMENPYNPERAAHIYWLPEVEHSPSVPGGKTYQMVYYIESDGRGYDGFLYLDCDKDRYATATFLDLDLLNWEENPPPESVAGYLMFKACGQRPQ